MERRGLKIAIVVVIIVTIVGFFSLIYPIPKNEETKEKKELVEQTIQNLFVILKSGLKIEKADFDPAIYKPEPQRLWFVSIKDFIGFAEDAKREANLGSVYYGWIPYFHYNSFWFLFRMNIDIFVFLSLS